MIMDNHYEDFAALAPFLDWVLVTPDGALSASPIGMTSPIVVPPGVSCHAATPPAALLRAELLRLTDVWTPAPAPRVAANALAVIAGGASLDAIDDVGLALRAQTRVDLAALVLREMRARSAEVDGNGTARRLPDGPRSLRDDVLDGRWPAHALLPDVAHLAAAYGVSGVLVRGVLARLRAERVLLATDGGFRVGDPLLGLQPPRTGVPPSLSRVVQDRSDLDGVTAVNLLSARVLRAEFDGPAPMTVTVATHDLGLTRGLGLFADAGPRSRIFAFRAGLPADLDRPAVFGAALDLVGMLRRHR
jgi:hypothetical protein